MARIKLSQIAIARSGDKGDGSNIGVMAKSPVLYAFLAEALTAAVVKDYFREICFGEVTRYELPNLNALNFILENSLGGNDDYPTDGQGRAWNDPDFDIATSTPGTWGIQQPALLGAGAIGAGPIVTQLGGQGTGPGGQNLVNTYLFRILTLLPMCWK